MALSASMTAGAPSGKSVLEQPEFGREIILDRRVIVHVVAGQIGESAGGEPHAIEPLLVEAMRGGFDREVGDALSRQAGREARAARSGPAWSAIHKRVSGRDTTPMVPIEAASAPGLPDLANEGGDRSLSAGAGHRDDRFRLARIEARGGVSERSAGVGDLNEGGVRGLRPTLGDDRGRALRRPLRPRASGRHPSRRQARRRRRPAQSFGCRTPSPQSRATQARDRRP